jgi:actin related protein 2/3 complex subunit 4
MTEGIITANIPYYFCIKRTLHAAICISNQPSRSVERHNKPEVEVGEHHELLLNPLLICRSDQERTLIETGINSVRVSVCFQKSDSLAELISRKYVGFLAQRADKIFVLRKKPTKDYDISFLITHEEAETMHKSKVIDFIVQFIADIDKDVTEMKIATNNRSRRAALEFFQSLNF